MIKQKFIKEVMKNYDIVHKYTRTRFKNNLIERISKKSNDEIKEILLLMEVIK